MMTAEKTAEREKKKYAHGWMDCIQLCKSNPISVLLEKEVSSTHLFGMYRSYIAVIPRNTQNHESYPWEETKMNS